MYLLSANGQLQPFLKLLVDMLPAHRPAPRGDLRLCSKEETHASFTIVHQLSLRLSVPIPASENTSLFLVGHNQRMHGPTACTRAQLGHSLQLSIQETPTFFYFSFMIFFFNRPTGEGNNREGLNICFHLMSFALALRGRSGEKSLQGLIYTAVMKEVMGGGGRVNNSVVAFLPLTEIKRIEAVGMAVVFWEL